MRDVTQGVERVRRWPKPKSRHKDPAAKAREDHFRNVQRATKFMAPGIVRDFTEAVKGTPLMPRDLLTSMMFGRLAMFILEDGRKLWPEVALRDVDELLDIVSQTPGDLLKRGAEGWEGFQLPPYPSSMPFQLMGGWNKATQPNTTNVVADLTGKNELLIIGYAVTTLAATWRVARFRVEGSAAYSSAAAYRGIAEDGQNTVTDAAAYMHGTSSAAARWFALYMPMLQVDGVPKPYLSPRGANFAMFGDAGSNTLKPITGVRVQAGEGMATSFSGGQIAILAR